MKDTRYEDMDSSETFVTGGRKQGNRCPQEFRNYVDGDWVDSRSGETFEVRNPAATDEVVSRHQASTRADIEAAIKAAVAGQEEWVSLPAPSRGVILRETAT